ncbi:alpha/beta hydrolase [Streptomyces sp. NPDC014006]|uniref:alpha/beta hydrolase n=1 Tax=Streptomyces sp. NPDC014006 TaxID=3364870 RepID=UPI0036F5F83D
MLSERSTRSAAIRRCALSGALGFALLATGVPAAHAGSGPDLSRFYDQKITWGRCQGDGMPRDLQCGKITVPLDYAHPRAGKLDLAVARYRATGHRRGSVVLNFGGPGGAGVPQLADSGKDFMGLTNGYDVVTFDPRGVGRSSPVSCGEGEDDAFAAVAGQDELADPRAALEQLRQAAVACARHSGPVLRHIGTVDAARDLDVMRAALGEGKLNYLGFSYGTRLGAVYAARFPDRVGRVVLDGVDTLSEPLTEQGIAGAQGQQVALDDFVDWCVQDIACPFGEDARSAREQVVKLIHSMDEDPVQSGIGKPFTGQDLVGAIGQGLYSKKLWPSLERALAELVQDGDTNGVMGFASGGFAPPVRRDPGDRGGTGLTDADDVPLDNPPAALMAINCADDPDRPSADRITRDLGRLRAAYEQASPVFGRFRLAQVLMCYGRPAGTDFVREKVKDLHSAKMLLVGTRGDPATPYRWTQETAERLGSSAVVLDNRGDGHTGYGSSKCVHRKVDDFLLYGSLPVSGSSCGPDEED